MNKSSEFARKNFLWIIFTFTILLQIIFLCGGLFGNKLGFPLDDAWIHQTYARNLLREGSWSFIPGTVSGGSTSPLWTMLLSLGYIGTGNSFFFWTWLISGISLIGLVICLCKGFMNLAQNYKWVSVLTFGLIAALEWHLQWAAASGMETTLFSAGIAVVFYLTTKQKPDWPIIGIITGLLVWVRPDELTLFGPLTFVVLHAIGEKKFTWKTLLQLLTPIVLLIGGYIIFNLITTGRVFPNTFYAKQMEYRELLTVPLWKRIFSEFSPLWTGVCLFLLPGFIYCVWDSLRSKSIKVIGFIFWVLGYVLLYAIRLPVIYQHGRYIIPVIPLFLLFGFFGTDKLLIKMKKAEIRRFLSIGVYGLLLAISLSFYISGISAYKTDLSVIERFMVEPAKWVKENTSQDSLIAVHDIGAMGYYADRNLVDLAGLISPEVIPFIRDEVRIQQFFGKENAEYFVGFSDWYKGSSTWGNVVQSFNMIVDGKNQEVVIIKLNH